MPTIKRAPGPSAHAAFKLGMIAAGIAGLAGIAFLYGMGVMSFGLAGFSLLVLFPIYLVFVASALSVWLGYGKDATDLRPVYREKKTQ